ncbi:MAG: hypothetical protein ACJAYB_001493 [Psychromonas sp.]|jgi:hypothetical protein
MKSILIRLLSVSLYFFSSAESHDEKIKRAELAAQTDLSAKATVWIQRALSPKRGELIGIVYLESYLF